VSDTSVEMEKRLRECYRRMSADRRIRIASSMFETARALIDSSLPPELTGGARRLALARRMYGGELPEAALRAFAYRRTTSGA
jgi:hypothetical protein